MLQLTKCNQIFRYILANSVDPDYIATPIDSQLMESAFYDRYWSAFVGMGYFSQGLCKNTSFIVVHTLITHVMATLKQSIKPFSSRKSKNVLVNSRPENEQ